MQSCGKKYDYPIAVFGIFACIYFALSFVFLLECKNTVETYTINYNENVDVNYNVCLKENNFFQDKCLSKNYLSNGNKEIVSKLIDKIYVDFDYNLVFDKEVEGIYSYYVKAIVTADKSNNEIGNYWEKEYVLKEREEVKFSGQLGYSFLTGVELSYDEYNQILNDFKKELSISADGTVKVVLVVESKVGSEIFEDEYVISSDSLVSFPLTHSSINLKIDNKNSSKSDAIVETINTHVGRYRHAIANLVLCYVVTIFCFSMVIYYNKKRKQCFKSSILLKKILTTYDSIIVSVTSKPRIKKLNLIKVEEFEELVDAQSEVRMPINYWHHKRKHYFILINNDMAWVYVLSTKKKDDNDVEEEKS